MERVALIESWSRTLPGIDFERGDPDRTYGPSDQTLSQSRTQLEATRVEPPPPLPAPPGSAVSASDGGRFRILEELGRGGMGIVYRAHQASLGRMVALKTLRADLADSHARRSFIEEALVTGGLDHPNIVPVHDFEADERGEVRLAMKLVGGVEWKRLLHPKTEDEARRARDYDLEKHLGVLLNICNAIEFAHARGIAHLDLKPENVMVGEFGEVLVMDWGIALDVRPEKPPASSALGAPHKSSVSGPRGTPRYMAPELAEGLGEAIGPRTDVYLLGACLHEVLTRRPPHEGSSLINVILAATISAPPKLGPEVPADLASACRQALARDPAQRFESVRGFRRALEDYLSHRESIQVSDRAAALLDRCRQAPEGPLSEAERIRLYSNYAESISGFQQARFLWEENARAVEGEHGARADFARRALANGDLGLAEAHIAKLDSGEEKQGLRRHVRERQRASARAEARRRQLAWGFFGALALLVSGLTGGLIFFIRTNAVIEQKNRLLERRKTEVEREKQRAVESEKRAVDEREKVQEVLAVAQISLRKLTAEVRDELITLPDREARDVRRRLMKVARDGQVNLAKTYGRAAPFGQDHAIALVELGDILKVDSSLEEALACYSEAAAIIQRLVDQRPGATDPALALAITLRKSGAVKEALGRLTDALDDSERALAINQGLAKDEPGDSRVQRNLVVALTQVGSVRKALGRGSPAARAQGQALDVLQRLAEADPDDASLRRQKTLVLGTLGEIKRDQWRLNEALEAFEQSLTLARRSLSADAGNAIYLGDLAALLRELGVVHQLRGRFAEAGQAYDESLAISRRLASADPTNARALGDVLIVLNRLSSIRLSQGRLDEALKACDEALALSRRLAALSPDNVEARSDLALSLDRIGQVEQARGRLTEAQVAGQESLTIRRELVASNPGNARFKRELLNSLFRLGAIRRAQGRLGEALRAHEEAIVLARGLAENDPEDALSRTFLAAALDAAGELLRDQGGLTEALAALEEARALRLRLARAAPGNRSVQLDLATSAGNLGMARQMQKSYRKALEAYRESSEAVKRLLSADPNDRQARSMLIVLLLNRSEVHQLSGEFKEAEALIDDAFARARSLSASAPGQLAPKIFLFNVSFLAGAIKVDQGQFGKALELLDAALLLGREAVAQLPGKRDIQQTLGRCLFEMARAHHARRERSKARGRLSEAITIHQGLLTGKSSEALEAEMARFRELERSLAQDP